MTEVNQLLSDLQQVASSLNRELDLLNERVAAFEKSLFELKLGITYWMSEPLATYVDERSSTVWGTHLGWTKHGDWGLFVREQEQSGGPESEPQRLRDASKEDRLLALRAMPAFLAELKTEAERVLKEVEEANRSVGLRPRSKE